MKTKTDKYAILARLKRLCATTSLVVAVSFASAGESGLTFSEILNGLSKEEMPISRPESSGDYRIIVGRMTFGNLSIVSVVDNRTRKVIYEKYNDANSGAKTDGRFVLYAGQLLPLVSDNLSKERVMEIYQNADSFDILTYKKGVLSESKSFYKPSLDPGYIVSRNGFGQIDRISYAPGTEREEIIEIDNLGFPKHKAPKATTTILDRIRISVDRITAKKSTDGMEGIRITMEANYHLEIPCETIIEASVTNGKVELVKGESRRVLVGRTETIRNFIEIKECLLNRYGLDEDTLLRSVSGLLIEGQE